MEPDGEAFDVEDRLDRAVTALRRERRRTADELEDGEASLVDFRSEHLQRAPDADDYVMSRRKTSRFSGMARASSRCNRKSSIFEDGDTHRHPMTHATGNSTLGYSTALNPNTYNRGKYKTL